MPTTSEDCSAMRSDAPQSARREPHGRQWVATGFRPSPTVVRAPPRRLVVAVGWESQQGAVARHNQVTPVAASANESHSTDAPDATVALPSPVASAPAPLGEAPPTRQTD